MNALEKVARIIGKNHKVTVQFKGTRAYTDGKMIVLPALPEYIDEANLSMIRGYCDHEVGHVLHTSFSDDIKKKLLSNMRLMKVTNLIEDLRIEKLVANEYLGSKKNLQTLVDQLIGKKEKTDPMQMLWVEGRRYCYGLKSKFQNYEEPIKKAFWNEIFEEIDSAKNTYDSIAIAEKMLDILAKREATFEDEINDGKSESEEGSEGEGSEGESSEGESSEGDGSGEDGSEGDGSEGDGSEGDGSEGDGSGEDEGSEGEGGSDNPDKSGTFTPSGEAPDGEANDDATDHDYDGYKESDIDDYKDPMDKIKERLEKTAIEAAKRNEYIVLNSSEDYIGKVEEAYSTHIYNGLKKELGKFNSYKNKIANMFNARVASKWVGGKETGKINAKALAGVKAGNKAVFKEKYNSVDADTAVSILLDFSGSMGSDGVRAAMKSALLFMEIFKMSKIKTEVLAYTTKSIKNYLRDISRNDKKAMIFGRKCGRVERLATYIFKEFSEPLNQKVKKRISNYESIQLLNNCDGENVKIAYERIRKQKEKRKILFVMTDGAVVNQGNNEAGRAYLKKVVKDIERRGDVEIIAIDIMSDKAKYYYKNIIEVNDFSNLVDDIFSGIKKTLKV